MGRTPRRNEPYSSEDQLIQAFKERKQKAFREIYKQLVGQLAYFAQNVIFSQAEAERIVVKAFSRVFAEKLELNSLNAIKSWLYLVVRNECIAYLKKHQEALESGKIRTEIPVTDIELEEIKAKVFDSIRRKKS